MGRTLVPIYTLAMSSFSHSRRCQNWEGGIGGVPGMEAHGGYTFCGLAALVILKKERSLKLKNLLVSSCCTILSPSPGLVMAFWDHGRSVMGRAAEL